MSGPADKVLIVNLTRLGDLLQTSPVIQGLKRARPGCQITLLAEKSFAEVCEGIPGLDRIYRLDLDTLGAELLEGGTKLVSGFKYVRQVVEDLRGEGFSLGLNYSSSRMTAVFMGLLRIPDLRGWSMTGDGFRIISNPWSRLFASMCLNRRFAVYNLVDYYLRMADIQPCGGGLCYQVSEQARSSAGRLLREAGWREGEKMVAVQLGASRSARCWPRQSFVELGRHMAGSLGFRVALIGGKLDRQLAADTQHAMGDLAINLCGATSIAELGAVLERCQALVTGDTGPMHMAAAVRTPVIGLFFGPASGFDTGPYGEDNVVLQARVPCAPCDHNVECLRPVCREEITPQMVVRALRSRLERQWEGLGREASGWSQVNVLRTGFDRGGFYHCSVLGRPRPDEEDLVRSAYRQMWASELDRSPGQLAGAHLHSADLKSGAEHGNGPGAAGFSQMALLAGEGHRQAQALAAEAARGEPSIGRCEELGAMLEGLDDRIASLGGMAPATAPLAQMFRFGKENLEGEELVPLARTTCALYHALARQASIMADLLGTGVRRSRAEAERARGCAEGAASGVGQWG